jgi:hypothetical protein
VLADRRRGDRRRPSLWQVASAWVDGIAAGLQKNSQRSRKTGSFGEEDLNSLPLSDPLRTGGPQDRGDPNSGRFDCARKRWCPAAGIYRRHSSVDLRLAIAICPPVIPIPRVSASRGAGHGNDRGADRSAVAGAHAISPHRQGTPWRRRVRGGALLLMVPYLVVVGGTQPRIHADCTMENDEPPLLL